MSTQRQSTHYNSSRQPEMSENSYDHQAQRRSTRREQSTRASEGTVSTMQSTNSSSRMSAATAMTEQDPVISYSKKIVVVGDGGCGKTCLLVSYATGEFPEKYVPTVFENYITHPIHPASGKTLELALWDTAGQEEYDRLRPLSYPEASLLLVCFAIDCPNSLENVMDKWYPEVLHFCPYVPLILVGLKSDLRNKRTCIDLLKTQGLTPVTSSQGRGVAEKMGAMYMECSSKERRGVEEIFRQAIDIVVANDESNRDEPQYQSTNSNKQRQDGGSRGVDNVVLKKKKRSCRIL